MIIAPHPDDDVIAAGGLIQRLLSAGDALRVVFITDGENNPWPQRFMERKWFLDAGDRARWGSLRRHEALCSLARLGITEPSASFLAFPDQGIARLARRGDVRLREALRDLVTDFQPTLIVSPSAFDLHSDHRAIAYYAHAAAPQTPITTYVVHGQAPAERLLCRLELSEVEIRRKREAIESHTSQLALSRNRFLAYARSTESFFTAEFDAVRVESAASERMIAIRHAARVVFGFYPSAGESGVKAAADVEDGAGDVPGVL
jgi:LmbE family N-acetylglucosaminyl deacetylase